MLSKVISYTKNFIKYIRRGGVVYTSISVIERGETSKGKTALITGGSSGFGYAIAKKLLSEGANVIITGRNPDKLNHAVKTLMCNSSSHNNYNNVKSLQMDLEDINVINDRFKEALSLFGKIDIFINNAGTWCNQVFLNIDESSYDRLLDTNLKGLFFLMQNEACYMKENGIQGKIINTTSVEGIRSGFTPYSASKWGANNLTIGLAKELAQYGITVNAIAPGIALTEINQELKKISGDNEYCPEHRTSRYVKVEEVAELAAFLVSDAANNITGQVIAIDGGWTLR